MIAVRWFGVAFALLQVQTYYLPYPDGVKPVALALVMALALGNLAMWVALRRTHSPRGVRALAFAGLALDFVIVFAFVGVHTFDVNTMMFALVYVLPLEGAIKFQRTGALGVMLAAMIAYSAREYIGSREYGYDFLPTSISFRMGIGLIIAAVAGASASRYVAERRRVEELYHHEREAGVALREMDELKNTFLTAVSHELRTPLTSMLGFSLTLEQQLADELSPQHQEMLRHIVIASQKLDRLLTDLLDLQRAGRGLLELDCHDTDVGRLVRESLDQLDGLTAHRKVELELASVYAPVDGPKVQRIVENLVLNAAKYTPAERCIWVSVSNHDGTVTIAVDDEGPGVPDDLKEAIFEPFRRGAGASAHQPGTGIGLSLVARFSRMHGGRAWVQDSEHGGASFRVELPISAQSPTRD